VPFCYFPEAVGGTEIYVRDLTRVQAARGDSVLILAPADKAQAYVHEGVPVVRYTVSNQIDDVRDLYTSAKTNVEQFLQAIERFAPDILHVHGVARGIVPAALEQVKRRGTAIVLTYHTPTTTCIRGTLLYHGAHPCDGVLDKGRCTACTLSGRGLPVPIASVIARAPAAAGALMRIARVRGSTATALRMRELVTLRHDQTRSVLAAADHIVAPAQWVARVLDKLGVSADMVTLSRQGISAAAAEPPMRTARPAGTLRLVYVGRVEPAKGVHLITRALRAIPDAKVELHIYGVVQGDAHVRYRRDLQDDMAHDARVQLHDPIMPDAVVPTLMQYDVLVASSQQFETGPLVVLEAFAAGLPVIGTQLGGIAELVQDGVNGLLVEMGSTLGWSQAFERLLREPGLLAQLRSGVRPPRTMDAVADDMAVIYRKVMAA
jgi:glycosyltransferase involved in cell wall biosynthesis